MVNGCSETGSFRIVLHGVTKTRISLIIIVISTNVTILNRRDAIKFVNINRTDILLASYDTVNTKPDMVYSYQKVVLRLSSQKFRWNAASTGRYALF